jgi:molybdopterin-guanine dinucleotide biosynthesis protein A
MGFRVDNKARYNFYICMVVTKNKPSRYKRKVKFNNISGVILAGGTNSRFDGKTKANLIIEGRTIISGITEILSLIFSEIIIVTNTPDEFSEHTRYKIVSDRFKNAGPLGGIHAALMASSCNAVFVVAGDMPLLNKQLIISQTEDFIRNTCDALIPAINHNIEPLHAIYSITILNRLEEYLSGNSNSAVREFFNKIDTKYLELKDSEDTKNAFTNINTPSDFINFKSSKTRNI